MQWRTAGSGCWGGALNIPYTLPLPFPSLPLMCGSGDLLPEIFDISYISHIYLTVVREFCALCGETKVILFSVFHV
jgi:hypothetical protein